MTASPSRRYTADEIARIAQRWREHGAPEFPDQFGVIAMLNQAAEDAARLEQTEKILSLDMELRQHSNKDYQLGWNAATDTLKVMLFAAGRREETEGR